MSARDHHGDGLIRVDFHVHTEASPDSLASPARLMDAARRKGIDRLAISDHNTIQGALRAHDLAPEIFIVGEEIMTTRGEILAFFVKEEVPPGLEPVEAISKLKEQGAFISISHPFDRHRKGGWHIPTLLEILPEVDAIETFNARCMAPWYNWRAAAFAKEHGLPGTHGSDAHAVFEVGRGSLLLPPFEDAEGLRENLKLAVSPRLTLSLPTVHFTSRYASWIKRGST